MTWATGVLRGTLTGGLLLVALGSTACDGHPPRIDSGNWQVPVKVFARDLCGAERHGDYVIARGLHLWGIHEPWLDEIDADCRAGRFKDTPPGSVMGAPK